MSKVIFHGHTFKTKISAAEIDKAVSAVAEKLNSDLRGKTPLFVAVLNGSFMFTSDLLKKIKIDCEVSFIKVASYEGVSSTGKLTELIGLNESVNGRTVIIVEDIVDTGLTLSWLKANLESRGTKTVEILTMLRKPEAAKVAVDVKYVGFDIPTDFVVGYGLDYNERYRNLDFIGVLAKHVYS